MADEKPEVSVIWQEKKTKIFRSVADAKDWLFYNPGQDYWLDPGDGQPPKHYDLTGSGQ